MAFYVQAIRGHFALLLQRKRIDDLLKGQALSPELRTRLESVQRIRQFAINELGLPAQHQYDRYVELGRACPVWSVMAAPELSFQPLTWRYRFVGRLSYRGYFSEQDAQQLAARLEKEGWEVYVSGIPAYSTLGWLSDPVLSSFFHQSETELAELLFHELTHQVLFVSGDTVFNESLAVLVADEGMRRYAADRPQDIARIERTRQRRDEFVALVLAYRQRLNQLYQLTVPAEEKRERKQAIMMELQHAYQQQKEQWGGYAGYDAWFAAVNNARLNAVGTYHALVPSLQVLLQQCDNEMPRFFDECRRLARLTQTARHKFLYSLMDISTTS